MSPKIAPPRHLWLFVTICYASQRSRAEDSSRAAGGPERSGNETTFGERSDNGTRRRQHGKGVRPRGRPVSFTLVFYLVPVVCTTLLSLTIPVDCFCVAFL